jgi:hypothetical protein
MDTTVVRRIAATGLLAATLLAAGAVSLAGTAQAATSGPSSGQSSDTVSVWLDASQVPTAAQDTAFDQTVCTTEGHLSSSTPCAQEVQACAQDVVLNRSPMLVTLTGTGTRLSCEETDSSGQPAA